MLRILKCLTGITIMHNVYVARFDTTSQVEILLFQNFTLTEAFDTRIGLLYSNFDSLGRCFKKITIEGLKLIQNKIQCEQNRVVRLD